MQNLEIKGSHGDYEVPTVIFNAETGVCELQGESYLEKTAEFYDRLLKPGAAKESAEELPE